MQYVTASPGVGKTHLAVALGIAAVNAGYRVYFTQMDQLMQLLKTEIISGRSRQQLRALYKANLVILDEVGFQPISRQEANLLFGLINRLYLQTSVIVTSNKGFEEWGEFLGDPVITAADVTCNKGVRAGKPGVKPFSGTMFYCRRW